MRPLHRPRKRIAAALAVIVAAGTTLIAAFPAAAAPAAPNATRADDPTSLSIALSQADGTPAWNWQDESPTNGIVRTNDLITYTVHLTANGKQPDTKVTLDIPRGAVLNRIPAFCDPATSTLTPDATVFGDPVLPVTATSWQSLPKQTLVCALGDLNTVDAYFDVAVKVRPEVPNGAKLPALASVTTSAAPTPLESNGVEATVAAQAQYDVSKNGLMPVDPNGGNINNGPVSSEERPCSYDVSKQCQVIWYGVTLSAPAGAKGNSPANEISFVDNLDPNVFFGAGATSNPNWRADYAPRLRAVTPPSLEWPIPGGKIGYTSTSTTTSSVRDSGLASFAGSPGGPYTVTFKNPDLTGYTYPSTDQTGRPLPNQQRAAVISQSIYVEYPVEAIRVLGVESGGVWTLQTTNTLAKVQVSDINGLGNASDADDSRDNTRTVIAQLRTGGSFDKEFAAEPGSPGSQRWQSFDSSWHRITGLPAQSGRRSGDAPVSAGQTVISLLNVQNVSSTVLADSTQNAAACDFWDVKQFNIAPGDYAGGGGTSQQIPSGGAAVWLSASGGAGGGTTKLQRVQYGVLGFTPDPSLVSGVSPVVGGCADPRITWYDSIAAAGGPTKVGAVRVLVTNDLGSGSQWGFVSIALKATDTVRPAGTVMPNYATVTQVFTPKNTYASLDDVLKGTSINRSGYVGDTHVGGLGDRVLAADLFSSINKQIQDPQSGAWVDEIQAFTGGQTANFKLIPSVSSGNPTAQSTSVVVEDCLPKGFTLESSSRSYTTVRGANANLTCKPGETYVRWDLGAVKVSDQLDPITYSVKVSKLLGTGTYTNTARVTAAGDPAALDPAKFPRVTDTQNVAIQVLRGVYLEKTVLTPETQVNLAGQPKNEKTSWEVRLGNMDTVGPEDMDVIDRLPVASGGAGSTFHGTMRFVGAEITEYGSSDPNHERSTLYYTTATSVNLNPSSAVNTNADGSVTSIWSSTLPADPATVTGVRLVREGAFDKSEQLAFRIDMAGVGNLSGDTYRNTANAVAHKGLGGLLTASDDSKVVGSSVGDRVWWDLDRDGVQDAGEPGASGVPVKIAGTDDLGNPVSLTTMTDASGKYSFPTLRASNPAGYTVTFTKPAGSEFTTQHATGSTAKDDSDAAVGSGASDPIALAANTTDNDLDAGLLPFGGLQINKMLTGAGVKPFGSDDTLVFTAVCTFGGAEVLNEEVRLEVQGGTSVTSQVFEHLPALANCTITETDGGHADTDSRPAPVTVTVPWDAAKQTGEVAIASLTNYYSAGTIALRKKVTGDEKAVAAVKDRVFTIDVTCVVEEKDATGATIVSSLYSGAVRIRGGQTKQLVDVAGSTQALPVGTRCFGNETDNGGATKAVVDYDSQENAAVVTSDDPETLQALTITAVNTFECTKAICPVPVVPDGPKLAVTGTQVAWSIGVLGTALVAIGGVLFLVIRSRRRDRGTVS